MTGSNPTTTITSTCDTPSPPPPSARLRWRFYLAVRLRNVAIVQGGWKKTLDYGLRKARGGIGLLFDPPYSGRTGRKDDLYAIDSLTVADEVADWCRLYGSNEKYRIAICGFKGEHWR